MTNLGVPSGSNAINSDAYAVNISEQVVGEYSFPGFFRNAYIWSGSTMTGLSFSVARGINDNGQIVGAGCGPIGVVACLYNTADSMLYALSSLGGVSDWDLGINNNGQIVGYSYLSGGSTNHAVLWSGGANGGVISDLGTLGGQSSSATAISGSGQIVGWADTAAGSPHAFLYSIRGMEDLGTLGGVGSQADAINSIGQIVGWANLVNGDQHAFIYWAGTMTDLNARVTLPQGVFLMEATGTNDSGQIVANGSDGRAYLLTPQ